MDLEQPIPRRRRWLGPLYIALLAAAYLFLLLSSEDRPWQEHILLGQEAPDIEFTKPVDGVKSLHGLRGRAVLLNFWANWCSPCLMEMPSLKRLEEKFAPAKLSLVAINVDPELGGLPEYVPSAPKNLVEAMRKDQLKQYKVEALPMSVLIDAKGIVQKVYIGSYNFDSKELIQVVEGISGS